MSSPTIHPLRITVITDHAFWFRDRGERCRIDALCRDLAERAAVSVVYIGALTRPDRVRLAEPAYRDLRVRAVRPAGPPLLRRLLARRPATPAAAAEPRLADFVPPALAQAVARAVRRGDPDVVLVAYIRWALLAPGLRPAGARRPQLVIDTLDVMSQRCRAFHAAGEPHWVDITEAEERDALLGFDLVLGIQSHDSELLRRLVPERPVITVGHAVPVVRHAFREAPDVRLLFLGTSGAPNRRAMRMLLEDTWPAVRQAAGATARLVLAGAVSGKLNPHALPPGVAVAGPVETVDALYGQTDVVVNPVSFGGGLKIKNVEALAHGMPLLTSAAGAVGLEDGAGEAFWIYRDATSLRDRLVELLRDANLRRTLSAAAHAYAARRLSAPAAYGALREWLALAPWQAAIP